MTAPTRASGSIARRAGLSLFLLLVLAGAWMFRPGSDGAVHVSGDGAADVLPGLDMPLSADPAGARLEVVLIRRAESLRHVPRLARLCRGRCLEVAVTVFHRPSLSGLRKIVVLDVAALGGGGSLDRGTGLGGAPAACATEVIRAEWLEAALPDCASGRRAILSVPGF
ncbi:MAG: hypothetical protein AAF919_09905 [Pseudomonadota bacterium]